MTFDMVALCREQPDTTVVIAAMQAAGPKLKVNTIEEAQLIELYHPDGRLMLTTEGARLVQVPGEPRRLLGITDEVPTPVWWVESRSPGADPDAEAVAREFTRALAAQTEGMSWSSR
ncbi:MAG: hypothetical protein GEU83_00900 [Pseudonocardiaceae bacterium]|nr:hypothetical protein [Pseudonocardiaceae bacterium]